MLRLCRGSLLPRTFLTIQQHYASRLTYSTTATATAEVLSEEVAPALLTPQKKHFSSLKGIISEETLKAITVKPFTHETMSAVQEEVLSLLPGISQPYNPENPSQLRDLLVRARTGTGKTLAFLVPTIEARVRQREEAGLLAVKNSGRDFDANIMKRGARQFAMENVGTLIISPTRELATQLANEVLKLSYHHEGFEVRLLCGGNSKQKQMKEWYKGSLDFVVATPGRLLDCLRSEPMVAKAIANTQTIILDEADTLLEMGFRDDLDGILRFLPKTPQRQTFMFSATVSPQVQAISRTFLNKEYKYINCVDDTKPTHLSIPQFATTLPSAKHQIPHILKLIAHDQLANPAGRSKIILFLPTTKLTQLFASFMRKLSRDVLPCGRHTEVIEIHSKLSQQMRSKASDQFRNARGASILVTSDVSARGIDYPRVTRVIQVGIPSSKEQYVHRIGRTGRGSNLQGRGDLILQPFEVGFLSWQLTEIPLKSLTTKQLDTALMELVDKYDAEPEKYFAGSGSPMFKHPLKPLMEVLDSSVTSLMALLDPIAVRETHLSSLGYYLPKAPDLRVAKNVILEGLNGWTMEACGLSEPPYVSRGFLNEMGLGDSKSKRYGQDQRRPSAGKAPWAGRGHVMPRGREIVGDDYSDAIENVSEYKTSRYSRKPVVAEDESSEYEDRRSSYGSGDRRSSYGSGDRRSSHGSGDRRSSYGSGDRRPSYGSREGGSSYGIRNGGGSSRAGGRSFSREGDSPYKRTEGGTPSWERR